MRIEYNPAIDVSCAMLQYARWEEIRQVCGSGYSFSPELEIWQRKIKSSISSILENDLKYLIGNFLGLTFLPVMIAAKEEITTVSRLIERLKALSVDSLPAMLFDSYGTEVSFDDVKDDPDEVIRQLEKAGGTVWKNEPAMFLDFIRHPESFMARLAGLIEDFYHAAVLPYEDDVKEVIFEQIKQEQLVLEKDPAHFFKAYCRLKQPAEGAELKIYISYYDEIDIIQLDEPLALIYGRCRNRLTDGGAIPIEDVYRLLSDESRRSILQLLCCRSWFIREIATELELTSATVSYHVSRLSVLDLVTYERGERKRIYYRADLEKVEAMLNAVRQDILGD